MRTRGPDNRFEVRLGRIRSHSGHERVTGFLKKVSRRGGRNRMRSGRTQRRTSAASFQRRVMVKVSIVRMEGRGIGAQRQHLKYIQRDSAAPGDERGELYDRDGREVDVKAFETGRKDDRHQFRIIVSPEDSTRMSDLSGFTRDLMSEMEKDLGTKLEWVAADHYDTGQPHTHIVVRGKRDDGTDLVMPKGYVSRGIRMRAQELVEIELGPVPEIEGRERLARMVRQHRLTTLDRQMMRGASDGVIDVSEPARRGQFWRRQLERARLRYLEGMGLADGLGKGRWQLSSGAPETLKRMGERGDIIKTMHRAMANRGERRIDASSFYDPSVETAKPITGRILMTGVGDDVADRGYMVLDTLEGKTAYVDIGPTSRLNDLAKGQIVTVTPPGQEPRTSDITIARIAYGNNGRYAPSLHMADDPSARPEFVEAHVRRLEALRRAGHATCHKDGSWSIPPDYLARAGSYERSAALSRPVQIESRSSMRLSDMKTAIGATWLDEQLMDDSDVGRAAGFGSEVENAKAIRRQFLVQQGVLRAVNAEVKQTTLDDLMNKDLSEAGRSLHERFGKSYSLAPASGQLRGTYRGAIERPSGKFAVIERSKDFTLVPWREVLERAHGKSVNGLIRGKSISWRFGKRLGVS
jgi:type IV secretory pathway VirD2 relaxase